MRARAELRASAPPPGAAANRGWSLSWQRDAPPFAFRQAADAVYLVGTAAAPVGEDDLSLHVEVESGAQLTVRSAASTIAWASTGTRLKIDVTVETGAYLDWQLQPLVVSTRCMFSQFCTVSLEPGAGLRWVEEVVFGRFHETPGRFRSRLDVVCAGRPLLRHELAVGPESPGWDGPAVLGANRALGYVLVAGEPHFNVADGGSAEASLPSPTSSGGCVFMRLDGPGILVQGAGPSHLLLRERLELASNALGRGWPSI